MIYLIKSLFCLLILLKSFDFIYIFQIKEYRFDRIFAFFVEEGIFPIFYLKELIFPAKTGRNFLLFIFLFITLVFLFFLPLLFQLILLAFFPFVSFVIISFFVLLTTIPVYFYRQHIINKATALVKKSSAVFIGITGSYGKTTTKEFLYQIISSKFKVAKTEENMNTDVGVALSIIKNLKNDTQFFIAEVGAYRIGEIKKVCDFIKPKIGIVTAIGNQHLALFGSQENLIAAKKELLEALPNSGRAYINAETVGFQQLTKNLNCKITSYFPSKIKIEQLVATDLGLNKKEISEIVKKLKPLHKRGGYCQGINNSLIINDSYNSNVEGFLAIVKLAETANKKNKIIISRGIIELGYEKETSYKKILNELNKTKIYLYTTDKLFKKLANKNNVLFFVDENKLLDYLQKITDDKTLIAIEGKFNPKTINSLIKL